MRGVDTVGLCEGGLVEKEEDEGEGEGGEGDYEGGGVFCVYLL